MDPLPGPICIIRVTLYSKIWREFDRGLYQFFKEYIFIPICAPSFSLRRKIIGVIVSYSFVLLWHGFYHHNIVWIILNIIALFMEMIAKALYSIDSIRLWREKTISDINFRRILAWLQIIPFATGLYSNFYFLGGSEVGGAYVTRILEEETYTVRWPFLLLVTLGYFNSHTAMEVDRLKQLKSTESGYVKKTK
uniref:Protein-cysteine N-palmitoyltransferase HHAT n=1 Tax=Heterorhabditis bacteriophora TaxID=37862 RepID=A0A1I7WE55_HETBA